MDRAPRCKVMSLAKHYREIGTAMPARDKSIGAGRLDHDDLRRNASRGERQVLGPRADDHRLAVAAACIGRYSELGAVAQHHARAGSIAAQRRRQKVHRRRTDEARDERIGRVVVQLERTSGLLDAAVTHHDDLVAHRHRLDLVVRDVDRRGVQPLMQLLDLAAHRNAQLRV